MAVTTIRMEVFRAGKQTDSAGKERDWTEADLDKIASSYDPTNHEAPAVLGHPESNGPADGWVKKVWREGKTLFAEIGEMTDDFVEKLKNKRYKKRSISLYPDLSLRHIGFLGAQPPAVKGLKDFAFADAAGSPIEYMDWQSSNMFRAMGRLIQGLRDAMIADKKDIAEVDRTLNQWDIDQLKSAEADDKPYAYEETHTEDPNMKTVAQLEAEIATFSEKLTAAETRATTAEGALAAEKGRTTSLESRVATMEKNQALKDYGEFCDRQIKAGRMLPAQKAGAVVFMESIASQAAIDFTEGEGAAAKTVKKTPLEIYQAQIAAAPVQIQFKEFATKDKAAPAKEDDKLSQLVAAKLEADKNLSFGEATALVLKENPDLNVAVEA
jgi:hypothetical protein